MPIRNVLFSICLVLALAMFAAPSFGADKALFISVVDGDSLTVEINGRTRELRLIGIDAPEWGQEYGTKAKEFVLKFCFGQTLTLEYDVDRKDKFGRVLAYAYKGRKMLNEELVLAGLALAVQYKPNTKHHTRLVRAQETAKRSKRGFWLHGGLKRTPYEWRKKYKKQ